MLHGRKGFDRIVWAAKNALSGPVTWLFHDLEQHHRSMLVPFPSVESEMRKINLG